MTVEDDRDARERNATIPVGRPGRPDEIAATRAFLCSVRASYIIGQLIMVDGSLVGSPF
jgi:3-oxoacyl-[acyl-carrier protein] reductase